MNYKVDKPYPKVLVERPNRYYAKILLNNYAGDVSEETAIHLYFYQSLITNDIQKELSDVLASISRVEMHHLKLLGEVIKLLGLKPVYASISNNNNLSYWSSNNVNYETDLKKMLEIDIKSEIMAIKNYQKVMMIIKDKYIRKLIQRIIEDEELHLKVFKAFYQKYVH